MCLHAKPYLSLCLAPSVCETLPVNGVFSVLTDCYSPTCTRKSPCYSISCPRMMAKKNKSIQRPLSSQFLRTDQEVPYQLRHLTAPAKLTVYIEAAAIVMETLCAPKYRNGHQRHWAKATRMHIRADLHGGGFYQRHALCTRCNVYISAVTHELNDTMLISYLSCIVLDRAPIEQWHHTDRSKTSIHHRRILEFRRHRAHQYGIVKGSYSATR